jgi:ATP-binding cassette subfamily B protein
MLIFNNFIQIWKLLSGQKKTDSIKVIFFITFAGFFEALSIGAVIPFLAVITNPASINEFFIKLHLPFEIENNKHALIILCSIFSLIAISAAAIRLYLLVVITKYSQSVGSELTVKMFQVCLSQEYSDFKNGRSSQLVSVITKKSDSIINNAIYPALLIISSTFMAIVILIMLAFLDLTTTIFAVCIFSFLYIFIGMYAKKSLAIYGKIISTSHDDSIKILNESIASFRSIVLDNTSPVFINHFKSVESAFRNATGMRQIYGAGPRYVLEGLGMSAMALAAYFMVNQGEDISSIALLGAFAVGAQRLLPIMQQIFYSWSAIVGGQQNVGDCIRVLSMPIRCLISNHTIEFKSSIALKEISYSYPGNIKPIFKKFNLEIIKGSRIGIVGQSGAGKSTLVDLISGLVSPDSGSVLIDQKELCRENTQSWFEHISYIPQEINLIDDTIAVNIGICDYGYAIDISRVKWAAHIACLDDDFGKVSPPYSEKIGENGGKISGGQKQRIAIARALYKKADLLIFDEATSALDPHTEEKLIQRLRLIPDNVTIIMISHRLNSLKDCHQVYKLDGSGSIAVYK